MPLHIDYRPNDFNTLYGNEEIKDSLESIINREDKPHSYLFIGPSGCGKTTIARIWASMLKVSKFDYYEYNTANTRGIDTIRDIAEKCQYSPQLGDVKFYLIDECFAKGTLIKTPEAPSGDKTIEQFKKGDLIYSVAGASKVKNLFINKVALDRVVKLILNNGRTIFTTKQHKFLTDTGWKEAQFLTKKDLLLSFNYEIMDSINLQIKDKQNAKNTLPSMRNINELLSKQTREIQPENLQQKLCSEGQKEAPFFNRNEKENVRNKDQIFNGNGERIRNSQNSFRENENQQSRIISNDTRKNEKYEENKWDSSCLERQERREREINRSSNFISKLFRMGNRSGDTYFGKKRIRISDLLQGRYWKSYFKNCNRSRWEYPQIEIEYIERFKKSYEAPRVRVESIEIYKPGYNDKSFRSIIEDKERNQGYVEFYDLEIENHPSYFANEMAVHNCHKLTNDAQNAILKLLEDAPKHVYFVLCTTDPDKLLKTLRTRCTPYEVKALAEPTIIKLLKSVLKKEGILDYPASVLKEIARVSDGCPRQALVLLDSVIDLEDEKKALAIVSAAILSESNSLELCRALLNRASWKEIAEIVSVIQDDPEKIRNAILTYFSKVLLDPKNKVSILERSSMIIDLFSETFIYSGKAGLVNTLYICSKS